MANNKKKSGSRPKGRPHHGGNAKKRRNTGSATSGAGTGAGAEAGAPDTTAAKAPAKSPSSKAKPAAKPANKGQAGSGRGPTRQERIEARRRSKRRKEQATRIGLPIVILVAIVGIAILFRGGSDDSTGPSSTDEITVDGPALPQMIAPGESIPNFTAPALGGGEFDLAEYADAPYVLSVWAPWCPHCQKELPIIDRVSADFPQVPVVTVVTAIDQGAVSPESFMTERNLNFPVAVDDATQTLAEALGVDGYPTIYFVKPDGTVLTNFNGEMPEKDVVAGFEALDALAPKPSPTPSPEAKDDKGNKQDKQDEPAGDVSPTPLDTASAPPAA